MAIPRYKRDTFVFVSNLKSFTATREDPLSFARDAYLLSEHYTTATSQARADEARRRRNLLISDNGNYSRMKAVAARFEAAGQALLDQARREAEAGGVRAETRAARLELIATLTSACAEAQARTDYDEVVRRQLEIRPHYMIGMEDLTVPVLMLCNLLDPVFEPRAEQIARHQRRTVERFAAQQQWLADAGADVANFLVVHGYDYESARQASAQARGVAKQGLAISYGGPMHSKRWVEHVEVGGIRHALGRRLPESYLAAVAITLGAVDGHPGDVPYHILGLGSPILVALCGWLLRDARAVSIDSTAPFRDAFAGVIYGYRQAYLKMNMFKVAASHLIDGSRFHDRSPFFTRFEARHPSDWDGLRRALGVRPRDSVTALAATLESRPELLRRHLPFFTPMSSTLDDRFETELRVARSGYNYWVLRNICNNIKVRRHDPAALAAWTRQQIDRYARVAHPKWAAALEWCWTLIELAANQRANGPQPEAATRRMGTLAARDYLDLANPTPNKTKNTTSGIA